MADAEPSLEATVVTMVASRPTGGSLPRDASRDGFGPDTAHLLRTTQSIQYQLSQMADQKANMVLGITFVILTLTVGQAHAGAGPPLPLLIMACASFVAATLAVITVMPAITSTPVGKGTPNLLFFGAFSQLSEEAFIETLMNNVADNRGVFESFARDIYQNGRVLAAKKYLQLGWAYRILLLGLFSSFTAFITPLIARLFGMHV